MVDSGRFRLSFSKEERLKGKKNIEELFKHGSSFYLHPLLLKYRSKAADVQCNQLLVSVPKKKFKRAVDRNLLKRRIKEAYRVNKNLLGDDTAPFFHIALIYLDQKVLTYSEIELKLIELLKRLKNQKNKEDEKKN
ncbi:ribonuclease P protein component [Marinoscillum sp. MHG1-6]|uniref:ribonuclease P protein component n=1 Tax=Marinoscillum sp. MHG1-6 TaxID=2959627 RepID=UPI002157BA51|nr:ribonuclease P protein component [Marinoscillum sp. MHG1-6]